MCLQVIKNGQMLGVHERRNRNTISMGSMAAASAKAEAQAAADAAAAAAAAPLPVKAGRRTHRVSRVSRKVDAPVEEQQQQQQAEHAGEEQQQQQQEEEEDYGNGMAVIGEVELLRLFNDGGK